MLLLLGLLGGLIQVLPVSTESVVYYVTPTEQSGCHGDEPCHTFEHYLNSTNSLFDKSDNVSLIFLTGIHMIYTNVRVGTSSLYLRMVGESQYVTIKSNLSLGWYFNGNDVHVYLEKLTISTDSQVGTYLKFHIRELYMSSIVCQRCLISITPPNPNVVHVIDTLFNDSNINIDWRGYPINVTKRFERCKFTGQSYIVSYEIKNLTLHDCTFLNTSAPPNYSPLTLFNSDVLLTGISRFVAANQSPILAYFGSVTLGGMTYFINNVGTNGGAMALYSSTLNIDQNASAIFINNRALRVGGAIYVDSGVVLIPYSNYDVPCFYRGLSLCRFDFTNNSAVLGGDNIYGASLNSGCDPYYECEFHYADRSWSSVSADPSRVCVCESDQQDLREQCRDASRIKMSRNVFPGETVTISGVVVGGDFGATVGTVYAGFLAGRGTPLLKPDTQSSQMIPSNSKCTDLSYTLYGHEGSSAVMHLSTISYSEDVYDFYYNCSDKDNASPLCGNYHPEYVPRSTPVFINIKFLHCPPGFTLTGTPPGCDCIPVFGSNGIQCRIAHETISFSWSSNVWIGVDDNKTDEIIYGINCPFDYCKNDKNDKKLVNVLDKSDFDVQCACNHAGRLCGGCRDGYSLAIGSSCCLQCSNYYLILLIFFAAAGFLLVLFISTLNFTVKLGMVNGLTFYANVVWAYQGVLFSQEVDSNTSSMVVTETFLRTFIAWLNLDFGIESCFFNGLNAFWKTWLQYLFPLYIWCIVGGIIIGAKHSSLITKMFSDRAVSVLATLFLLSYTKLLRIVIESIGVTPLKIISHENTSFTKVVWSLDGRYGYCHFPHILLFLVAVIAFLFLWLPYTLLLLLVQWLRKISHLRLFKWVSRFNPFYDVYFAPLKDKHQYWFGVLLVRGIILLIFALTHTVYPNISRFSLLVIAALLLCYANYKHVYKNRAVQLVENFFLIILVITGGAGLFSMSVQYVVVYVSIAIAFLAFCGMVVLSIYSQVCHCRCSKTSESQQSQLLRDDFLDNRDMEESQETQKLLQDDENVQTVATY